MTVYHAETDPNLLTRLKPCLATATASTLRCRASSTPPQHDDSEP